MRSLNYKGWSKLIKTDEPLTQVEVRPLTELPKKKVGLMGGTFNPPHLGHLIIAKEVKEQLGLDEVWFMPDNLPPHIDKKDALEAKYRVKMVALSIKDEPDFKLEELEIKRGGVSYTYDTILELRAMYPEIEFYFIIGGDMVAYLPKWYRIDELVKLVQFVSVERKGYPKQSDYPLIWVDVLRIDLSSSLIREKLRQDRSIKYLVTREVEEYIKQEGLYRDKKD